MGLFLRSKNFRIKQHKQNLREPKQEKKIMIQDKAHIMNKLENKLDLILKKQHLSNQLEDHLPDLNPYSD